MLVIIIVLCYHKSMNNNLINEITYFIPHNEQEQVDKESFLAFMNSFDDCLTRSNIFGHLTASAFVVSEDFKKALVVNHNIFKGYIYPGGHADGESNLYSVALREVEEETGIKVSPVFEDAIFAIQALAIDGHVKRGKYVSPHIHYDVLYLMQAKDLDKDKIRKLESENSDVRWIDLDETYGNLAVDFIKPINKKIVEKIRALGLIKGENEDAKHK